MNSHGRPEGSSEELAQALLMATIALGLLALLWLLP